jgi:hypothetical protein
MPRSFDASPFGLSEAELRWRSTETSNPFHEESYVIAWRCQEGHQKDLCWVEEVLKEDDNEYDKDESRGSTATKWRYILPELPEYQKVYMKVAAQNRWGRGPWTEVEEVQTFARPNSEGGFKGPLGPAGRVCGDGMYSWGQTSTEVSCKFALPETWKAKDIQFKATPSRIEIRYIGGKRPGDVMDEDETLLAGKFPGKIKSDEVDWEIENYAKTGERFLVVLLPKMERFDKWPHLVEGDDHPCVDVRHVRFFTDDKMFSQENMNFMNMGGI